MPINTCRFAVALMCVVCVARAAEAQDMAPGIWTGTFARPDAQALDVTFDVTGAEDSLSIVMLIEDEEFEFESIRLTESRLRFTWDAGQTGSCVLVIQDDGGYEGECEVDGGENSSLSMRPPVSDSATTGPTTPRARVHHTDLKPGANTPANLAGFTIS